MNLLDLMADLKAKPAWRMGRRLPGSDVHFVAPLHGDRRWLGHCPKRTWGRWYRWDAGEAAWCCIDPDDSTGINAKPDTPPRLIN
jgi:hypothetical protein